MKELRLTNSDKVALVDDEDYQRCIEFSKWFLSHLNNKPPYVLSTRQNEIPLHRFILNLIGRKPLVDHWDRNIFNNQKRNLKIATHSQNMINRLVRKDSHTKFKGVEPKARKYRAYISINKVRTHLGYFKTAIEAAIAYDDAAIIHYGEFAQLNFPLYGA